MSEARLESASVAGASDAPAQRCEGLARANESQEVGGTGGAPNGQELGGTGQAPNQQEMRYHRVRDRLDAFRQLSLARRGVMSDTQEHSLRCTMALRAAE
ncbi:MAG: hypothetical protein RBU37_16060 [Myxococcota bacterium]|nr:hypothetical protein [Myxococcota bacterium]